ncbi:ATPase Cu transporting protein 7A [Bulinus truncatus]|nr:ATPase Cu transporting protein 7A [Bulinus truncatus]
MVEGTLAVFFSIPYIPFHKALGLYTLEHQMNSSVDSGKRIIRSVSEAQLKGACRSKKGNDGGEDLEKCFLKISGMTCASCVATIEKNVSKMDGINKILVSLMAQRAEVTYDPAYVLPNQIANKVEDLGFSASVIEGEAVGQGTCELTILGMTCSSCVNRIESEIKKKRGILSVSVALATNTGKFTFDSELTGPRDIIESVKSLGFEAKLRTDDDLRASRYDHREEIKRWRTSFLWSLVFGGPSMIIMMVFMFGMPPETIASHYNASDPHSNHSDRKPWSHEQLDGHYHQKMIIPGLDWLNLLMFLLATPVQLIESITTDRTNKTLIYSFSCGSFATTRRVQGLMDIRHDAFILSGSAHCPCCVYPLKSCEDS